MLAAVTGALAVAGARDIATLVVALETASLPAIGLVALRRDAQGAQAGVTLLLTAVGSLGLTLLGRLAASTSRPGRCTSRRSRPCSPSRAWTGR